MLDSPRVPWHCPACNSTIRHSEADPKPRVGERYRCHVCRLSLEFDPATDKLTTTPLDLDHHVKPSAPRVRALPAPVANLRKKSPVKKKKRAK